MLLLSREWVKAQWKVLYIPVLTVLVYTIRSVAAWRSDLVPVQPEATIGAIGMTMVTISNLPMVLAPNVDRHRQFGALGGIIGAGIFVVSTWWGLTRSDNATTNYWLLASSLSINMLAAIAVATVYTLTRTHDH